VEIKSLSNRKCFAAAILISTEATNMSMPIRKRIESCFKAMKKSYPLCRTPWARGSAKRLVGNPLSPSSGFDEFSPDRVSGGPLTGGS